MKETRGRLIKGVGGTYFVAPLDDAFSAPVPCAVRGKLKGDESLIVGDYVTFSVQDDGRGMIEKIETRKNRLPRPPIANVDRIMVLLSHEPKPDFLLVDKIIANCILSDIEVILCVTKSDLNVTEIYDRAREDYGTLVEKILHISVKENELFDLEAVLANGLTCLVGQSAVGKTSLLRALCKDAEFSAVGQISVRSGRGKHTTRHSQIYRIDGGGYVADTPGFSFLNLDVEPEMLPDCFPDYFAASKSCRFRGCTHMEEPSCAVREGVKKGEFSAARYERYRKLFAELTAIHKRRYK